MGWQIILVILILVIPPAVGIWWMNQRWHKHTSPLLEDIAKRKAIEDDMARHLKQLKTMRQVSEELSERLSSESLLDIALDAAIRLSDAAAGFIYIENKLRDGVFKTIGDYKPDFLADLKHILSSSTLSDFSARLISPIDETYPIPHLADSKAQMIIPLQSQENVIGILNLETPYPNRFVEEVFQFMQILAGQIGVALDNGRLYNQAQRQVIELQALYNKLSDLEHLKTDMIRIAAHDLRNPLSVLMGYVQLLEQDKTKFDRQYHDYFGIMSQVVKRIYSIINEMLSLERIEQIATHPPQEAVYISDIIDHAILEYKRQIDLKRQRVSIEIETQISPVLGDKAQIHEAIINLLGNAVKYTPNNGKIAIYLKQQHNMVIFTITDTGMGIPENQQKNLFKPFFRLQNPENNQIEGTGLGLSLVRNIIERHQGEIVFSSKYGEGSTFGFKLPATSVSNQYIETTESNTLTANSA
ncbi:MAG: GAF domain-containing sensor histidine kinase [Anaerolineae bacterium]|nr:GAF domain-containing sensor histidine kinase [Anaerolineae bacterium]